MPQVTVLNVRADDRLPDIEAALRQALTSMPQLGIDDFDLDIVPVLSPQGFDGKVARINVDLWIHPARTKDALQELATRVAAALQAVAGQDRKVKVVIRPYDVNGERHVLIVVGAMTMFEGRA